MPCTLSYYYYVTIHVYTLTYYYACTHALISQVRTPNKSLHAYMHIMHSLILLLCRNSCIHSHILSWIHTCPHLTGKGPLINPYTHTCMPRNLTYYYVFMQGRMFSSHRQVGPNKYLHTCMLPFTLTYYCYVVLYALSICTHVLISHARVP